MKRWVGMVLALGAGLIAGFVSPGQASAQSAFGCDGLARLGYMPVVEGRGGVFFRVHPDLHNFYPFSDETVERLGELSDALATGGTRLIYLPVPTKSLAMPAALTPEAEDFGFDPALATTVYRDILKRLEDRGIATVDVRKPMVQAQGGAPTYFRSDHRWSAEGARLAANAVAARLAALNLEIPGTGTYQTEPSGEVTLTSNMFAQIQQHCQNPIPPVTTSAFVTPPAPDVAAAPLVVVGTEYSDVNTGNFTSYLSRASGLLVAGYSVPGGGGFAAISSYLTSDAFRTNRPKVLIWEVPVEANLAQFADQPLRELIALAGTTCRFSLTLFAGDQPNRVSLDLSTLDPGLSTTLFIDGGGAPSPEALFTFRSRTGLSRSRVVLRHPDQVLNGRFALPLSGLWPDGAASVEVELTEPFGPGALALACIYSGKG